MKSKLKIVFFATVFYMVYSLGFYVGSLPKACKDCGTQSQPKHVKYRRVKEKTLEPNFVPRVPPRVIESSE
jgi:hypothetical protein